MFYKNPRVTVWEIEHLVGLHMSTSVEQKFLWIYIQNSVKEFTKTRL